MWYDVELLQKTDHAEADLSPLKCFLGSFIPTMKFSKYN